MKRLAVVTGAASGIGLAAARALRRDGFRVVAIDRNDPGTDADQWFQVDLDDPTVALPVIDDPIVALVNAAGLPPRPGSEGRILRVNFLALRRLTLHLLPQISAGGSIVNVASKAGSRWQENIDQVSRLLDKADDDRLGSFVNEEKIDAVRAYDLSKEAVIAWTKSLTGPLIDRDLRMNCVSPAAVDTPILQNFTEAFGERATRGIALVHRAGTPEEVAAVIAFLAREDSSWVRGSNIEVDGGLTAQLECEALFGRGKIAAWTELPE